MFVEAIQNRQGLKVACVEEIAFHQGWISAEDIQQMADAMGKSSYGDYLRTIAGENG
jgi:glucose-1-phosphate thymidylyltransferase